MTETWRSRAACKGTPLRLWFHPHDGADNYHQGCSMCTEAKTVCAEECDDWVQEACLREALSRRVQHGVQGGLDARQRDRLLQARRRKGWA